MFRKRHLASVYLGVSQRQVPIPPKKGDPQDGTHDLRKLHAKGKVKLALRKPLYSKPWATIRMIAMLRVITCQR